MLSLLHPHSFRCKPRVVFSRHTRFLINLSIGIETESLYQFMHKFHGILCFWHRHFFLVAYLVACNLKQFGVCLSPPHKRQVHWGLCCFFPIGWVGFLDLVSLRSTLIFLVVKTSSLGTLTFGLGIDLTRSNLVGVNIEDKPLYTNLNPILLEADFWTFNMLSSLEVEVLLEKVRSRSPINMFSWNK